MTVWSCHYKRRDASECSRMLIDPFPAAPALHEEYVKPERVSEACMISVISFSWSEERNYI